MDEEVDVVNDKDEVIGSALKSECHAKKLLHRGSSVLVFRDSSYREILLQKRSASVRAPHKICLPGGHVSKGESYGEAAIREFHEEVLHGKVPSALQVEQLFRILKTSDDDHEFLMVHRIVHPGPFIPDPREVSECSFWDIDDAMNKVNSSSSLFTGTTLTVLKEYARRCL